ncbi:MAG: hypothetical protein ACFFEX_09810 [Candidatus Thorarchaeota archaeon]
MAWFERWEIRWIGLGTLILAALLGLWVSWGNIMGIFLSSISILSALLLALSWRNSQLPIIIWDEQRGVLAILWSFTLEVIAGRLMTSVPIGIDLSHSASKVLRALHARYDGKKNGEVRFFICRPTGDGITRAGMLVARRGIRFIDGIKKASSIADEIVIDAAVLESSMRAAYPHMPIDLAGLDDLLMVTSGGVEPYAQVR